MVRTPLSKQPTIQLGYATLSINRGKTGVMLAVP
jgi:hypothetical protein